VIEEPRERAEIIIVVNISGDSKTFTADATTTGDVRYVAERLLSAVKEDANDFIRREVST
jgi:hypothetical protein